MRHIVAVMAGIAIAACAGTAGAQGQLNIVCSVQAPWCEGVAADVPEGDRHQGLVHAESCGRGDGADRGREGESRRSTSWYTGTGDPHLQAAEHGPHRRIQVADAAAALRLGESRRPSSRSTGLSASTPARSASATTRSLLAKKNLPPPKCWADLAKPIYKDEMQMANPNASGTAYSTIATLVQIFGEDKAFELLKGVAQEHQQLSAHRRAVRSARSARGETAIAVTFLHDGMTEIANGFPVKIVVPCEGTGYEVGSMSIVKGAKNLDNAKQVLRLGADARRRRRSARRLRTFQVPSNKSVASAAGRAEDGARSSSSTTTSPNTAAPPSASGILEKWDREVYAIPR